ncbi:MAG: hypothetical protein OXG43_11070 [Chloroflexi bacterium]|nr:hypothetical protein [Chloroflexota bacterium]
MTVDPAVLPGFLLLAAELIALAAVGYVVVRVALRQDDERMALAQGLVVGLGLWVVITNFVLYVVPGLAGAAVGWGLTVAIGAAAAWRSPDRVRPQLRTVAGFAIAVLALSWIALTSRQLVTIPEGPLHIGLAATMRAGIFPPELPWNPSLLVGYHYGFDLLVGLLAPPIGPDLAFTTELLGTYIWTSFVLIVVTTLIHRGSWQVGLVLTPLLLTVGAWTLVFATPPEILRIPVPAGVPSDGLRTSLAEVYWPAVQLPWSWEIWGRDSWSAGSPPNIWKPSFVGGYALALVVLERVASRTGRRRPSGALLALLLGSLALFDESIAPIALALWVVLEADALWAAKPAGRGHARAALRAIGGPALAALLVALGGGVITHALTDTAASGVSLGWHADPGSRRPIGELSQQPGGLGLLGLGPVVVAAAAVLLARRDRTVLALAAGAMVFLLAGLTVQYGYSYSGDVVRLDGHARNFALLALLLALSMRLAELRPRWRTAVGALLVGLVVWPTAVGPARNIGLAVGQGTQLANAAKGQSKFNVVPMDRYVIEPFATETMAAYIRDQTATDARILSATPLAMSLATGRPSAQGFPGVIHVGLHSGPDDIDARRFLEPAAFRRLGLDYVHLPDTSMAELPARARRWLADPALFEPLLRDGGATLFRVRPAFLSLDVPPTPGSFTHLRSSIPPGTTVYLTPQLEWSAGLRVASVLPHARLLGTLHVGLIALTPVPWTAEPLGEQAPGLVVLPASMRPWRFAPAGRLPVWHSDEIAVYSPDGSIAPIMPPPPRPDPPVVDVRLSDVRAVDGRITFDATFDNHSPNRWSGQDWVVIAVDDSPWNLPRRFGSGRGTPEAAAWFGGWLGPSTTTTTHTYQFDIREPQLAIRNRDGVYTAAASSGSVQGAGDWALALRLRHEWRPGSWRDAAYIPVLRITVSEAGEVSFHVFDDVLDGSARR